MIAAGLFIRTFDRLLAVPLGFDSDRVLVVEINASRTESTTGARLALYQRLTETVADLPGVTQAAVSLNTPVNRGVTLVADYVAPGMPQLPPPERRAIVNYVTLGVVSHLRPAYPGRPRADDAGFNRVAARRCRQRRVREEILSGPPRCRRDDRRRTVASRYGADSRTIVGVVGNAVEQSLRYDAFPALYLPMSQWRPLMPVPAHISLSVRAASGSPSSLARSVAERLTTIDRRLAFTFRPLEEQIDAARQQERLIAWLSTFFGGLALLLAAVGLFGIASSTVVGRRTEIGIRMALGAQRRNVVNLALRQTILATVAGLAIGLAAAAALTRYLEAMLFGITPLDPVTFIAAPVVLALVALVACFLPARRATSIDPMVALRCE